MINDNILLYQSQTSLIFLEKNKTENMVVRTQVTVFIYVIHLNNQKANQFEYIIILDNLF